MFILTLAIIAATLALIGWLHALESDELHIPEWVNDPHDHLVPELRRVPAKW